MKKLLPLLLLFVPCLHAQGVPVAPLQFTRMQLENANGVPLAAGCVDFFAAGTSTPQAIYSDNTGTFQLPNPLTLDAAGEADVWLTNTSYRIVVSTGAIGQSCAANRGTQLWTSDNKNVFGIINTPQNLFLNCTTSDPPGTQGELACRSDLGRMRFFFNIWDSVVTEVAVETLTNKTLTAPTITSPTTTGTDSGVETLTNKTITSPSTTIGGGAAITSSGTGGVSASTANPAGITFDAVFGTYRVTADQVITAGASLTTIPGLTWTMPANTALNVKFSCDLLYSQATAAASDSFGIQDITVAPTNIETYGRVDTSAAVFIAGNVPSLNSTTATTVVTFTPSAPTTIFGAHIDGFIEQPSNAATSVFQIMSQFTGNAGTIKRGSSCQVF